MECFNMFILFLKRFLILSGFIVGFFLACESTEQAPDNRGTKTYDNDDDNTTRNRRRPSSGSSGGSSSSSSSSDGGDPPGDTSPCGNGACPSATDVDDCPSLTTITFGIQSYLDESNEERCYDTFTLYRHPLITNDGEDSEWDVTCSDVCSGSPWESRGSASPNQKTILSISGSDDQGEQRVALNKDVVGRISGSEMRNDRSKKWYIYFKRQTEETIQKFELPFHRWTYGYATCGCDGNPSTTLYGTEGDFGRYGIRGSCSGGEANKMKLWLAKETESNGEKSCLFFH